MDAFEKVAKLKWLCQYLTGDEIDDYGKIFFNNPYIKQIINFSKHTFLTRAGHLSATAVQALNVVSPDISVEVYERDENFRVLYAGLRIPTPKGMKTLIFINK